jgi:hypothetical protein
MNFGVIDQQFSSLAIHPEVNVVELVRITAHVEVGAGKIDRATDVADRVVDLDELQRQDLVGLVVFDMEDTVGIEAASNMCRLRCLDVVDVELLLLSYRRLFRLGARGYRTKNRHQQQSG